MRKSLRALAAGAALVTLLAASSVAQADQVVPISNLPSAATPLTGSEYLPCVQGGVTKKCVSSSVVSYTSPLSGGVARPISSKLGDVTNLLDFGAACDGATDDTAAINAAHAIGPVQSGRRGQFCYTATLGDVSTIPGPLRGPGQIKGTNGSVTAPYWDVISSQPTPGNWNGIGAAYTGDDSHIVLPMGRIITGATTLGTGSGGIELINPENAFITQYFNNQSGQTCLPASAPYAPTCRAMAVANYFTGGQNGYGDYSAWTFSIGIGDNNPHAANWGEEPAAGFLSGQVLAGANHVYMEPMGDFDCSDQGYDASCIIWAANMARTVNAAALGDPWIGMRIQTGTVAANKPIDAAFSVSGPMTMGLDLSSMAVGHIGIALPAGVGIYGRVTNVVGGFPNQADPGSDEIVDSSDPNIGWQIISNSVTVLSGNSTDAYTSDVFHPTKGIEGTGTNDNASAGIVGEYVTNSTTNTSLVAGVVANATSETLTAGDWDVQCDAQFTPAATTNINGLMLGISTTSATLPANLGQTVLTAPFSTGQYQIIHTPVWRESLATATTIYCTANSAFNTSTMTVNGFIRARRVR